MTDGARRANAARMSRREGDLRKQQRRLVSRAAELTARARELEAELTRLAEARRRLAGTPAAQRGTVGKAPIADESVADESVDVLSESRPARRTSRSRDRPQRRQQRLDPADPAVADPRPRVAAESPSPPQRGIGRLRATPGTLSVALHLAGFAVLAAFTFTRREAAQEVVMIRAATSESQPLDSLTFTPDFASSEPTAAAGSQVLVGEAGDEGVEAPAVPAPTLDRAVRRSRSLLEDARASLAGDGQAVRDPHATADFFGVKARGRTFVFVVDSSKSMKGGRFEAARRELSLAVRRLRPQQAFYVVFFDEHLDRMQFGAEPEIRPVAATTRNFAQLDRWLGSIELEAGTGPEAALAVALELSPDVIYLLSDGKFGPAAEEYLATQNVIDDGIQGPRRKSTIHTIGFYSRSGEEVLRRIAGAHGGQYRFVAPPVRR